MKVYVLTERDTVLGVYSDPGKATEAGSYLSKHRWKYFDVTEWELDGEALWEFDLKSWRKAR
jgi:hypothetical protein